MKRDQSNRRMDNNNFEGDMYRDQRNFRGNGNNY